MSDPIVRDATADVERLAREGEAAIAPAGIAAAIQELRQARSVKVDKEREARDADSLERRKRDAITEMLCAVLISAKDELGDDFQWDTIKFKVEKHEGKRR